MDDVKVLRLRRADACGTCDEPVDAGERAGWDKTARVVICLRCLGSPAGDPVEVSREAPAVAAVKVTMEPTVEVTREPVVEVVVDGGVPGASLAREYARRRQAREDRVRGRFPRIGGFLLAVTEEPASTRVLSQGAAGEQRIAQRIEKVCGTEVLMLHNRRLGTTARSGDIDHIAVTPSGVVVIDAKHYPDAKVRVRRTGGLFSPVREQLIVRGRDRTSLVDGLEKQLAAVKAALSADEDVPITAILSFVDADLPVLEKLTVRGHPVLGLRRTATLLRRPGPLDDARRRGLWDRLGRAFPPA